MRLGLAHGDRLGLELEPSPSMLMESHVISNKWVVRGIGALGLPMMEMDLGLSWSTRLKFVMEMGFGLAHDGIG